MTYDVAKAAFWAIVRLQPCRGIDRRSVKHSSREMNFSDRISNQTTIYYSQGRYNRQLSGRLSSPNVRSPKKLKKGKESTKEWVARTFTSEPLCATRNSTSTFTNLKSSIPTVHDQANASKDGKPAIFFQQSLVDSINDDKFKFSLVGKFLRWRPSLSQIRDWVSTKWKLKGQWSITLLDHRHVFIRLDNESDMLHVWTRNRWFIRDYMMRVFKWFPMFIPSNGEPSSAAVWVSLPCLPVAFFQEEFLYPIASLAGKVFAMDVPTRNFSRTNVARVCVEVDLLKEHPRQVWVGVGEGGFWQDICYERLPSYCTDCREQGHSTEGCQANGSDSRSRATKSKPKMKNLNYSRASGKQVRICPTVEDDAGGRHSMRLGSSQSSIWKDKDKEIDESLSDDSSRGYSSEDTDNNPKEVTAHRGESSYTPTIEQNLSAQDSNGMANQEIDALGKSGFSETAAESVTLDTEENRESFWQIVQKSLPMRPKGLNFLWRSKQKHFMPEASRPSHLEKFKYSEIKKMTNSFRDRVGKEGFSSVFKGKLPDGQKVAVKVTNPTTSHDTEQAFLKEIQILSNASHVNIIRLLGFCWEGTNRILVYEFMPNSSLAETTKESCSTNAKWSKQYCKIAIGIARGLNHLHHEFDPPILHLHINPSAILLDKDFYPKLTGLGLAHISTDSDPKIRGTVGYNPPEFYRQWRVSREADVYSYGITVLEMALGSWGKNPHWVRRRVIEEGGIESFAREETQRKMVIVGMWCTQHDPARRPSFSKVIDMLEGSVDELSLPSS